MKVDNKIATSKDIKIENNTQEQVYRKIGELIHALKKLFLKFKKSNFHIENHVQNIIRKKKREFYETNLWKTFRKP